MRRKGHGFGAMWNRVLGLGLLVEREKPQPASILGKPSGRAQYVTAG